MKVYLFRHGQKDTTPLGDPDLTSYGHSQAKKLAEAMQKGDLLPGTQFVSSPKARAQSTLRPASQLRTTNLQVTTALDQREGLETADEFRVRIQQLINNLDKKFAADDVVYLCTHHDWIEESMTLIPSDTDLLDMKYWRWYPAQYMHFEIHEGIWHLKKFDRIDL